MAEWARLQFEREAARIGRRARQSSVAERVEGASPVSIKAPSAPLEYESEDLTTDMERTPPCSDDPSCIIPQDQILPTSQTGHRNLLLPPLSQPSSTGFPSLSAVSLGRACLLVALEEEAAIEMHPEVELNVKDLPLG